VGSAQHFKNGSIKLVVLNKVAITASRQCTALLQ